jgi:NAD(P)-dependent dehydrogenase (short-subunit alcohol dehydrogenase family)
VIGLAYSFGLPARPPGCGRSRTPGIGALAYTASKWELVGMSKQLAATSAERSIRVNIVHPTGVASGMTMNPPCPS